MKIRLAISCVFAGVLAGISTQASAQPMTAVPAGRSGAQCFRGSGWLFMTAGEFYSRLGAQPSDTVRGWMSIFGADSALSRSGRAEMFMGVAKQRYRATWTRVGDSLRVEQQTFPSPSWYLVPTVDDLRGRVHFVSDLVSRPPARTDFSAQLTRVSCEELLAWP